MDTVQTVTLEQIQQKIISERYDNAFGTLTICILELQNGTLIVGQSACVDPQKFDAAIGQQIARENAVEQIWALEGYLLKEKMYQHAQEPVNEKEVKLAELFRLLATHGGTIVPSAECSESEIAEASANRHMAVDAVGMGFVWRP